MDVDIQLFLPKLISSKTSVYCNLSPPLTTVIMKWVKFSCTFGTYFSYLICRPYDYFNTSCTNISCTCFGLISNDS